MLKFLDFKSKKEYAKKVVIPALEKNGLTEKAYKMLYCGSYIKVAVCKDCGTAHFAGAVSCKDKFCPVCQKKRSLLWLSSCVPVCEELLNYKYQLMMFTFTIRTTEDMSLKYCIDLLYDSFRYMTHQDRCSARWFKENILGGVRSLEVKVGSDKETGESTGKWHPHFHMLVCLKQGISLKANNGEFGNTIRMLWNNAIEHCAKHKSEVSYGNINIKTMKLGDKPSMLDNLQECFKYITKYKWDDENVRELVEGVNGVRLINTFGNFRYYLHENKIENDMCKSYLETASHFCAVCGGSEFISADMKADFRMQLFDLQSYSRYEDIDDSDAILEEYKNKEGV